MSFEINAILYNPEFAWLNIRTRMLISSHRRCSMRKDVLKNFAKFTEKHLYWGLLKIKLQGSGPQKETPTQVLSCEFCEIFNPFMKELRTTCLQNTSRRLLLNAVPLGFLSGAKPDPDYVQSVIADHCFLKHFISTEVI